MREMQLIYASRPFGYDDLMLCNMLLVARDANKRDGITGALISREDVFVQMLEGPRDRVAATFNRIKRDERHVDVTELWSGDIDRRMFSGWDMLHDRARTWMWTPEEVRGGRLHEASAEELLAMFARVAADTQAPPA